jgi:preprotein translocase subunit SecG
VYIALVVLHVFLSLGIIAIVLLQAGKGADIGSAFGGGGSQAVFGSMGTPTILGKITTAIAVLFMLTSFGLTILSSRPSSVVPATAPLPATAPAPAGTAPANPAPASP